MKISRQIFTDYFIFTQTTIKSFITIINKTDCEFTLELRQNNHSIIKKIRKPNIQLINCNKIDAKIFSMKPILFHGGYYF